MDFNHKPVLLQECITNLNIKPDGIYVDGTVGGAGHSSEIYKQLGEAGLLVGLDQDTNALEASTQKLNSTSSRGKYILINSNFKFMKKVLSKNGINAVDGILMDLGVSSHQLDEAERGFSYNKLAPLDMRMDRKNSLTAETIVNEYDEESIKNIIRDYGEEKWAARIARFIVENRTTQRITNTEELVSIIKAAIPSSARREGPHPAKRTFQALRIAVNDELGVLQSVIEDAISLLQTGGRLLIITFHSLEDRIVKTEFQKAANPCTCPSQFPVCVCHKQPTVKLISRKPIISGEQELKENPRARSAKLRVVEKL